jgi:hypothetical protein
LNSWLTKLARWFTEEGNWNSIFFPEFKITSNRKSKAVLPVRVRISLEFLLSTAEWFGCSGYILIFRLINYLQAEQPKEFAQLSPRCKQILHEYAAVFETNCEYETKVLWGAGASTQDVVSAVLEDGKLPPCLPNRGTSVRDQLRAIRKQFFHGFLLHLGSTAELSLSDAKQLLQCWSNEKLLRDAWQRSFGREAQTNPKYFHSCYVEIFDKWKRQVQHFYAQQPPKHILDCIQWSLRHYSVPLIPLVSSQFEAYMQLSEMEQKEYGSVAVFCLQSTDRKVNEIGYSLMLDVSQIRFQKLEAQLGVSYGAMALIMITEFRKEV